MNLGNQRLLVRGAALVLSAMLLLPTTVFAGDKPLRIYGAGATFPGPLFNSWLHAFNRENPKIQGVYQEISSTGGITDLIGGRVDFAGADFQLPDQRAAEIPGGIVQLPMAAAGIVLIYNLPGIDTLKLSREAVIGIFRGTLSHWNDPVIAKANPGLELPNLPITLVTRSGAAGTSHNLTHHLSAISPEFKAEVGVSLTPKWPEAIKQRGALLGARGGDGVAAQVKGVPGAIGYVAYPHSSLARVPAAAIENKAGNVISPSEVSFAGSMQSIRKNPTIGTLVDPPGDGSYPMIAVSWMLVPKQFDNPAKKEALVQIIEYALGPGQELAKRIGYIPFSPAAIAFVRDELGGLDNPEPE